MISRMVRAALLDVDLYKEVEHNQNLTAEALRVVIVVTALVGMGTALSALLAGDMVGAVVGLFVRLAQVLLAWLVISYVTYYVGTHFFNGTATFGQLLRTLGYAFSPYSLWVVSFIPVLDQMVPVIVALWALSAGFVAVRQALNVNNQRAAGTIVVALVPALLGITIHSIPLAWFPT